MEDNTFNPDTFSSAVDTENAENATTADTANTAGNDYNADPVVHTNPGNPEEQPLYIVTPHKLNKHYLKKFKLSEETKVKVPGWELKKKKLKENEDETVKLFRYFSEADGKKRKKLMKGTAVETEGETAYFFCPNEWLPFLILFFAMFLILGIMLIISLRGCDDGQKLQLINQHNVVGDEKETQESTQEKDDGIIYAGFPDSFTINSHVKYLSVQNSVENKGRFYTTVRLLDGDKVIYDMGDDVIKPGKYVNIDLYSLLSKGEHKITICQGGYAMDETFTQAATSTSQVVTVTVVK